MDDKPGNWTKAGVTKNSSSQFYLETPEEETADFFSSGKELRNRTSSNGKKVMGDLCSVFLKGFRQTLRVCLSGKRGGICRSKGRKGFSGESISENGIRKPAVLCFAAVFAFDRYDWGNDRRPRDPVSSSHVHAVTKFRTPKCATREPLWEWQKNFIPERAE